jgi:hypothetical protein
VTTSDELARPEWSFVFDETCALASLDTAPTAPFTWHDVAEVKHLATGRTFGRSWRVVLRLVDGRWIYAVHRKPIVTDAHWMRCVARRFVTLWWGALSDDDRARFCNRGTVTRQEREEEMVVLDELLQSDSVVVRVEAQARIEQLAVRVREGAFSLYDLAQQTFVRAGVELAQLASCLRDLQDVGTETSAFTCRSWPSLTPCRLRANDAIVPDEERLAMWRARPAEAQVQTLRECLRDGIALRILLFNHRARSVAQWVLVPFDE